MGVVTLSTQSPKIAILCWEEGHIPKGLMQLESLAGNSTNLNTYPFPVRICRIEGANIETVLENPSRLILSRMIEASLKLEKEGCAAITTSCGFNAVFQKELAEALSIPVFTSSLLQVPFVCGLISPQKKVAVITAKKAALKKEHLRAVGISDAMPVEIFGMESSKEWNKIFLHPDDVFDLALVSNDVIDVAIHALSLFPNIASFVLECTDLPPFSRAIREATGLPVFDFQTLMGMIVRSIGLVSWYS